MSESHTNLKITNSDISVFSKWSGDCNPLHVDEVFAKQTFFGTTIAHGILTAIESIISSSDNSDKSVRSLDIEFRGPVYPEKDYEIKTSLSQAETEASINVTVRDNSGTVLIITIIPGKASEVQSWEKSWLKKLTEKQDSGTNKFRTEPHDKNIEAFQPDDIYSDFYTTGPVPDRYIRKSNLNPVIFRVLALCSYIVGMESPGLRSLFTRLHLDFFQTEPDSETLAYQLKTIHFDSHFRMLHNKLTVAGSDGHLVASGELRSYIRFSPFVTDLKQLKKTVIPFKDGLKGKTALVTGGSRGLGANITTALALAGCHVYASFLNSSQAAEDLSDLLKKYDAEVDFLQGDAGDADWCSETVKTILSRHGKLDFLILNASSSPMPMGISSEAALNFDEYISYNLRLIQRPLAAFLPAVNENSGVVVAISSSFVTETPKEFPHYVALKYAVEGIIQTVSKEYRQTAFLVPRPPRLQTSWNDTPTGVIGSLPPVQVAACIANSIAAEAELGSVKTIVDFPVPESPEEKQPPDLYIMISASFTVEPILPGLQFWFRELDINIEPQIAPYGQILQELLNPFSLLSANKKGLNAVLLRLQDWLRELPSEKVRSADYLKTYLEENTREFVQAVLTHRGHASAGTLLIICPSDSSPDPEIDNLLKTVESKILQELETVPGLELVVAENLHDSYNIMEDMIADSLRDKIGHIPYHKSYYHFLATLIIRNMYRKMVPLRKVVVADCDNTLWKGVVGEVGPQGVEFEESHKRLHLLLTKLSRGGIVVSLCSKNEEPDVWEVFDSRKDFGLEKDIIVGAMINWHPKSENIKRMASRLNLGLDSFVFIDDNPVECAEVQASCPDVLTLQWPLENEKAIQLINHIWEIDPKKGTQEDAKRSKMYQEEFSRQESMEENLSFTDFLRSLELKTDLRDLNDEDLPRASQLTMRTNQFNFTTRRRTEEELKDMMADDRYVMQAVRVRDRFGDYGLVGFYIAQLQDDLLELDTFLLSCRVLGRGVEHFMIGELGRIALKQGLDTVRMVIFPTQKNTPARDFLKLVSPEETCSVQDDGGIESIIPADYLSALEFVPAEKSGEQGDQQGQKQEKEKEKSDDKTRTRAQEIMRTAYELSDIKKLTQAVDGELHTGRKSKRIIDKDLTTQEVNEYIYEVFASELRTPAETLKQVDLLENLGCDSFKIVEITVALIGKFPWLPETLLFEHRSISDIVKHIQRLYESGTDETEFAVALEKPADQAGDKKDIAVVGMSVRCAGVNSSEELWNLLNSAGCSIKEVTDDRDVFLNNFSGDEPHWAGLMDFSDKFDAEFFGIAPKEAEFMDPQGRLFLETAWHALEDAGCVGQNVQANTGVFAGVMYGDYGYQANWAANNSKSPYRSWESFSIANRISHFFRFSGPSFSVDTACSSSGTALHLACHALKAGDCRVAVVGGVNLILNPNRFNQLSRLGILSPTGKCRAFGSEADGTLIGEGVGVVVLKLLEDALQDKDQIYGVIKGSALSSGTGTVGFTVPNPNAQALVIQRALNIAGVDPRTVSYVETHGTGTSLGDPIEVRGLTLSYEDRRLWDSQINGTHKCRIGSIKPNIGHLESGACMLGLIKILLQFKYGMLLPTITSEKLNPQIPFNDGPFDVQRKFEPWEQPIMEINRKTVPVPRRAGLSSFGVGGANAHFILEEPPGQKSDFSGKSDLLSANPYHILTISARHKDSLQVQADRIKQHIRFQSDQELRDICCMSNISRAHFKNRLALLASDNQQVTDDLKKIAEGQTPAGSFIGSNEGKTDTHKVAFLFTGQGSQYISMGHKLYNTDSVFRKNLDQCAELFDSLTDYSLFDVIFAQDSDKEKDLINQTQYTQPALFAVEYALSRLWLSWGIKPDFVMGHSVGELVALTVSGMLSLEDGMKLISARGRLMQVLPNGGKMAAVRCDEETANRFLEELGDSVSIAALNGPDQTVISGDGALVEEVAGKMKEQGFDIKFLNVSHAFHSPLIAPVLDEYLQTAKTLTLLSPDIPVVSCVDANIFNTNVLPEKYWERQVRDAVRFNDAVQTLDSNDITAFIEVGPHPTLLGMASRCLGPKNQAWLVSLRKNTNDIKTLYESVAKFYVQGGDIDWKAFNSSKPYRKVSIPTYPFKHSRHWIDPVLNSMVAPLNVSYKNAVYNIEWHEKPNTSDKDESVFNGLWIVFADKGGMGLLLTEKIIAKGLPSADCIVVNAGDSFIRETDDRFTVNPSSPDDFDRLWQHISENNKPLKGIIQLWSLDLDGKADLSVEQLNKACSISMEGSLHILQTVVKKEYTDPPVIWFVTKGATGSTEHHSVWQSVLWGFGRVAALEIPEIWGGLTDITLGLDNSEAAEKILYEIAASDGEDQLALGLQGRFVPRLVSLESKPDRKSGFDKQGTYIITGGTGAVGLRLAKWLISKGVQHLTLVSRHGSDSPGAADFLNNVQKNNVDIDIVSADAANMSDMENIFARIHSGDHPLKGVFHLAGADIKTSIPDLTVKEIHSVAEAKINGAWILHDLTKDLQLDYFVLFSSIASVLGSERRAHYAGANAFLDSLSHFRHQIGLPSVCVNWGPWKGGGMASDEDIQQYSRIGNHALEPAASLEILDHLIGNAYAQAVVADIEWETFRRFYEARRPKPFIELCGTDENRLKTEPETSDEPLWIKKLNQTDENNRFEMLCNLLRHEIANMLGYKTIDDISPDMGFSDMGMDSLRSVELVIQIQNSLGIKDNFVVHDYENIISLGADLLRKIKTGKQESQTYCLTKKDDKGNEAEKNQPIVNYSEKIKDALLEFCKLAWPDRSHSFVEPRWNWMFIESARRFNMEPRMWIYKDSGSVVGFTGAIPVQVKLGNVERTTAWCVDTMVLESYRHKGIGPAIMLQVKTDMPFTLSLGQTEEMQSIIERLGWHKVSALQTYVYPLNPHQVLKGKLNPMLTGTAGAGIQALQFSKRLLAKGKFQSLEIKEPDMFDERHDRLWNSVKDHYNCAVKRDSSYLNWKYVTQPGQKFIRLEMQKNGETAAIAILMIREPHSPYLYRRAFIVDLVVEPSDKNLVLSVLECIRQKCMKLGIDSIVFELINSDIEAVLESYGFMKREPERYFWICLDPEKDSLDNTVLSRNNWLITKGDSDIDRPEGGLK
ncbi:MAG: SDR family NAD(P)-dependent oxidoreductase [Desulfobacteraceae bacterium]|nr:SDR family NAD(P)-dependent oxidoreductase [Desulfobacteraceae bacterium]